MTFVYRPEWNERCTTERCSGRVFRKGNSKHMSRGSKEGESGYKERNKEVTGRAVGEVKF